MTGALMILCVGAFAAVALATSALVGVAWSASLRWRVRLSARAESRLLLAAALAPGFVAMTALCVSFVPSLGWLPDHCLGHAPHHPHLCTRHATESPALALMALAGIMAGRWIWAGAHAVRNLLRLASTTRALRDAARTSGGLYILPTRTPEAFVMGLLAPRVYVSEGLLGIPEVVDAVLAHEHAHARRRDPLRQWLAALALACHLPGLAARLAHALRRAQEMAADTEAAVALRDGPRVADALVKLARVRVSYGESIMGFVGGDIEERVLRLLSPFPGSERPGRVAIAVLAVALPLAMLAFASPVHHTVETILGILS
jgi:hypothetical protein